MELCLSASGGIDEDPRDQLRKVAAEGLTTLCGGENLSLGLVLDPLGLDQVPASESGGCLADGSVLAEPAEDMEEAEVKVQFFGGPQDGRRMEVGARPPAEWQFPDVMTAKAVVVGIMPKRKGKEIRIPAHVYRLRVSKGKFSYHYQGVN